MSPISQDLRGGQAAQHTGSARGAAFTLLIGLLTVDLFFVVLHLVHLHTPMLDADAFSIEFDRGYAEMFQYLKAAGICTLLAWLFLRHRAAVLFAWVGVYGYLLADDMLRVHERGGRRIAEWLNYPASFGLQPKDLGELTVAALVGAMVLPALLLGYWRATPKTRRIAEDLFLLLLALLFFGIGVDMVHAWVAHTPLNDWVGMIEDGGEMAALSATLAYLVQRVAPAAGAAGSAGGGIWSPAGALRKRLARFT